MIFTIVYKDLLQAFKDKKGMMLSFLLPIVLITLFALVYGSFRTGVKDKQQDVIYCDEDLSTLSKELKSELEAEGSLRLIIREQEEGKKLVLDGDVPSMLLIKKGFEDSVAVNGEVPIEFFFDESKEMQMGLTKGALLSTLMPFIGKEGGKDQIHSFIDEKYATEMPEDMIAEIHADIESQFAGGIDIGGIDVDALKTTAMVVKEGMRWGLIQAFAGTSVMMLLFSITGMGSSLIDERDSGTLKRILYSPIKPWQIMIAKFFSGFTFAIIQMTILVVFVWLAFQLDIFRNFGALVLLVLSTAFAVSGFGILIAALSKSKKQVESLSLIVILVMSAIGGSMIPLFMFPEFLETIAGFTINYWAIDGFYDNLGRDVGFLKQLLNISILLLFGVGSSLLAIFVFTKRLKKDY